MKHKIISLFTGAGGLDWGFHTNNNFDFVISNEILEPHLRTYANNYKIPLINLSDYNNETNVAVCGDIHNLNVNKNVDVVIGCPPCQDFSVLRGKEKRAGVKVKRGKLYQQFLRIIKSTNPKVFVFENVPGMVSANKGLAYEAIQEDFINEGFELVFNQVINFSNLGVPQNRRRLIIIGIKKELIKDKTSLMNILNKYLSNNLLRKYPITPLEVFEGKTLKNLQNKYETVIRKYENSTKGIDNKEAIKWNETYNNLTFDIVKDYCVINDISDFNKSEFDSAMIEHENTLKILDYFSKPIYEQSFLDNTGKYPRKNKRVIERMYHIPPFFNFKVVDNTPWKVKGLMSNIYRRIHPLKPSPTIIAYGGGGTGGYHYEYNRQGLTNRERARLQTFPDDYLFNGKTTEIRAQIGEAVPVLAGYWISKAIDEILLSFTNQKEELINKL